MFPIETTKLRARPWPSYLILIIGVGMLFIPQTNNEQAPLYIGMALIAFAIIMWFLFSKASIILDDNGLTHKTVFRTREIYWDSITKTYIKYQHHGKSGSHYWFFENADKKKVKFSINLYSRESLRTLAEAVTIKCKKADIDQRISNMSEGQFPWYIW